MTVGVGPGMTHFSSPPRPDENQGPGRLGRGYRDRLCRSFATQNLPKRALQPRGNLMAYEALMMLARGISCAISRTVPVVRSTTVKS